MRETKADPVPPKFDEKPKGLTSLQSLARGMEWVDPLALGQINYKTFRLISDTGAGFSVDVEPLDPSAREKMNYYSDKFDAKLFLARVHLDTSAAELESGALCFVSCKTIIDDIESKLKRIEEDPEGAGTRHLFNCIQGVSLIANRAFEPLFERKVQTKKIRSVQGLLQSFPTLFNLPSGNISKGEYDLAVIEYRKAKSIVLPSHAVDLFMQSFRYPCNICLSPPKYYRSRKALGEHYEAEHPELFNTGCQCDCGAFFETVEAREHHRKSTELVRCPCIPGENATKRSRRLLAERNKAKKVDYKLKKWGY